jgi:hypothetical protein
MVLLVLLCNHYEDSENKNKEKVGKLIHNYRQVIHNFPGLPP